LKSIGLVYFSLYLITSAASAQAIAATDTAKHVGQKATVCGSIASEHTAYSSRGTPTFINLDKPYRNQVFTVLVWGDERGSVGKIPVTGQLCATGTIKEFRGSPEIVLHGCQSWYVPHQ
jgi:hypothetical protein